MGATLFDLGGPITPVGKPPAAPRGGRRNAAAVHPESSQPHGTATHHGAPTPADAPAVGAPAVTTEPTAPTATTAAPVDAPVYSGLPKPLPPFDPDDTSFYAMSYRLLRASPAELAIVEARHRAAGYCSPPSPDALAGAISACAPRERPAGPWVTCECGSQMLEYHYPEHLDLAARADAAAARADAARRAGREVVEEKVWSLHNVFMQQRAQRSAQ